MNCFVQAINKFNVVGTAEVEQKKEMTTLYVLLSFCCKVKFSVAYRLSYNFDTKTMLLLAGFVCVFLGVDHLTFVGGDWRVDLV